MKITKILWSETDVAKQRPYRVEVDTFAIVHYETEDGRKGYFHVDITPCLEMHHKPDAKEFFKAIIDEDFYRENLCQK